MSPERTGDWAQTKKPTRVKKCFYIRLPSRSAGCVCAQGRFSFRSMGQVIGVWPTPTDGKERKKLPLQKKKKKKGVVIPAHAFTKQPVLLLLAADLSLLYIIWIFNWNVKQICALCRTEKTSTHITLTNAGRCQSLQAHSNRWCNLSVLCVTQTEKNRDHIPVPEEGIRVAPSWREMTIYLETKLTPKCERI